MPETPNTEQKIDEQIPPCEPSNLEEFLWYIKRWEKGIFVRAQIDGKWKPVSLAELPSGRWAEYVARFIQEGALPVRIREDWEII